MNREQNLKALKKLLKKWGIHEILGFRHKLALAILDSLSVDSEKAYQIFMKASYEKGFFTRDNHRGIKALATSEIIEIKERFLDE